MERMPPPKRDDASSLRSQLIRELAKLTLDDPDAPETLKTGLRLGETGRSISSKIAAIVWEVGTALMPDSTEEQVRKARELLEYLQLMETGLDSFLEAFQKQ